MDINQKIGVQVLPPSDVRSLFKGDTRDTSNCSAFFTSGCKVPTGVTLCENGLP